MKYFILYTFILATIFLFYDSLVYLKVRIYLFLILSPIFIHILIFILLFYINYIFSNSIVYAMEDNPNDPSKIIMDQRKIDNDLMLMTSEQRIASRIQAIAQG